MITYEQAHRRLHEWVQAPSLRNHCRAIEIVMRKCAHVYGQGMEDEEIFGIAGLLHDADWERAPHQHPKLVVDWLTEIGESEIAAAIAAHGTTWGKPHETTMAKALVASDELCGFIVACAKVRPDGLLSLVPKSVLKKLRDSGFASNVDRGEIQSGLHILGVDFEHHAQVIIDALRPNADELGIRDSLAQSETS